MIVNLEQFIRNERPHWERLDTLLGRLARDSWSTLSLPEGRELESLYQRASADLARLAAFSAEPEIRTYLERLVARAYAEIHGSPEKRAPFNVWNWLARDLPRTFRERIRAFWLATALFLVGSLFGALAIAMDPPSKDVLMPFSHLQEHPEARVAREESAESDRLGGSHASFAGQLMTHNTRIALLAMALGMTWGVGTGVLMVMNGIGLGAVVVDYVSAGQSPFLFGWLLPHGSVEIPAILIAGQAGFVLAGALLNRRERRTLAERLRAASPAVITLSAGAGLFLVWAGFIESFFSQHHEPTVPYWAKIAFGCLELVALTAYVGLAGRRRGA